MSTPRVFRLLTVSGSLRTGSSNSALLDAVALLATASVVVERYDALASIPAFNPDVEEGDDPLPERVLHWRRALSAADAVLISSPEYAHGVPGVLKNALDWVVGSGEFVGKPTGLVSVSSASQYAHPQLAETLAVMSAALVPGAVVVVDLPRRGMDARRVAEDRELAERLHAIMLALVSAAA